MQDFKFSIPLAVRVNDINYANHVGNHLYYAYFQESRSAYLNQFGYNELNIAGFGIILSESHCKYKQQLLLNDKIIVACCISELKTRCFTMQYQIKKNNTLCAEGLTINHCIDKQSLKIVRLPQAFIHAVEEFEHINLSPKRKQCC